jgi:L-2-hydroxyglutarate oxidase
LIIGNTQRRRRIRERGKKRNPKGFRKNHTKTALGDFTMRHSCDIAIVGSGILGVSISFWLSKLYDCSILLIDKEGGVAHHTSSRNTGVVHRPFYLNPEKKKIFARCSQNSYTLWSKLALKFNLPWRQLGTIEVALDDSQIPTLEKYKRWSLANGMEEWETEILNAKEVREIEPEVECAGAIYSKTDTCVDYCEFTRCVFNLAEKNGVKFLGNCDVVRIEENGECGVVMLHARELENSSRAEGENNAHEARGKRFNSEIECRLLINAAGGCSLDLAHQMGLAKNLTDLHFRGEYWVVSEPFASKIRRNVYSVAKYPEFPFLDPHFIVRASGRREIGPNAVLVSGPGAYSGLSSSKKELLEKIFERPLSPKIKLFTSRKFLALAWKEWRSSLSKSAMCGRVKQFIPALEERFLVERGLSGIRSSVIDGSGFVPEALVLESEKSLHVINYNSPGATGAPSFSAYVVSVLMEKGFLDSFTKKKKKIAQEEDHSELWNFEFATKNL